MRVHFVTMLLWLPGKIPFVLSRLPYFEPVCAIIRTCQDQTEHKKRIFQGSLIKLKFIYSLKSITVKLAEATGHITGRKTS